MPEDQHPSTEEALSVWACKFSGTRIFVTAADNNRVRTRTAHGDPRYIYPISDFLARFERIEAPRVDDPPA